MWIKFYQYENDRWRDQVVRKTYKIRCIWHILLSQYSLELFIYFFIYLFLYLFNYLFKYLFFAFHVLCCKIPFSSPWLYMCVAMSVYPIYVMEQSLAFTFYKLPLLSRTGSLNIHLCMNYSICLEILIYQMMRYVAINRPKINDTIISDVVSITKSRHGDAFGLINKNNMNLNRLIKITYENVKACVGIHKLITKLQIDKRSYYSVSEKQSIGWKPKLLR